MTIKQQYENVADIPEGMEALYEQNESGYGIKTIEGLVSKGKVDEFRENNIGLRKQVEGFESKAMEYERQVLDMQEELKSFEKAKSTDSLEDNDAYWKKEMAAQIAAKDEAFAAERSDWETKSEGHSKALYEHEVGSVISEFAGKSVVPEGQAHFTSLVKGMVSKNDKGEHVIEDRPLQSWLADINTDSKFGYLLNKPSSVGAGMRNDGGTPFSGVGTAELRNTDAIKAGLPGIK